MSEKNVYLVTAGAHGIGKAITGRLLGDGAFLAITWHTDKGEADAMAGDEVRAYHADFGEPTSMEALVHAVWEWKGRLDGIICNASSFSPSSLSDTSVEEFRRLLGIHVSSPLFLAKAYHALLESSGTEGNMVFILDSQARSGKGKRVAYRIAKTAMEDEVGILASVTGSRLRVNGVSPSLVTPHGEAEERYFLRAEKELPLAYRQGEDEIAQAVSFLLHAPSVTGEILHVDGGRHLL